MAVLSPGLAVTEEQDRYYQRSLEVQGTAGLAELFSLYARSAEGGNAVAQYNVAMMYANGESVNVDYQQAAYWFRKSAAQGFPPAQYRLGEMYYFGRGGLERNLEQATELFEKAAEQGDPDAQVNLAMLLGSGEGAPLDPIAALALLERAQRAGHELAPACIEQLEASRGEGFTRRQQDEYWDRQRLFWIEEAASYGVREAQEAVEAPSAGTE